jgi:2TM domain
MDSSKPSYSQNEVNEILKRALAQEAGREHVLSHDDLIEVATEVGIDRDSLDRAMAELAQEHTRALARQGEAAEIAAERGIQLKRFGASLASLSVLNFFLYFISVRFTGGNWFVWPLLGSGALLAMRLRHVIYPYDKVERRRRRFERQRERARKRAERDEWKQRLFGSGPNGPHLPDGTKAFETVVQAGVSALLSIAERKLSEHRSREGSHKQDRSR